jgi:hypothetical protein
MNLPVFSLKVDFAPLGHAKGLSYFRRLRNSPVGATVPGRAQTSSPSECFRVRIPENTQAALAKISIRCENRQGSFLTFNIFVLSCLFKHGKIRIRF